MKASKKDFSLTVLRRVENIVATHGMLKQNDSVLIGVSGGPDSVALLHVLRLLVPRFSLMLGVAHLNHCLRGHASDKDAEFVKSIAGRLNLPFYIHKEDVRTYQIENRLSPEEAGRRVRYTFLNTVARTHRFNRIALGHHADDNAELVLMNLLRGSGPTGLSGIPPVRDGKIIRPLIKIRRSEIIRFLNQNRLRYISDSSNQDMSYLRNSVRHRLIPMLQQSYNPKIPETLNRLSSIMRSEEAWIEDVIHPLFKSSVLTAQNDHINFSVAVLRRFHPAVQRRIIRKGISRIKGDLRRIAFTHIDAVIRILNKGPAHGSLDLPDDIRIRRIRDNLYISKEKRALHRLGTKNDHFRPPLFEHEITAPVSVFIKEIFARIDFNEMNIKDIPDVRFAGQYTVFFDKDTVSFPMILRNFRPGDRFRPLGLGGTQKLKKFFIDRKIPRNERVKCPILLSRGKIIWVAGHRIDESVRLKSSTRTVLKVELFLA
jgi:tRNA(Ile)-lysidine synthase